MFLAEPTAQAEIGCKLKNGCIKAGVLFSEQSTTITLRSRLTRTVSSRSSLSNGTRLRLPARAKDEFTVRKPVIAGKIALPSEPGLYPASPGEDR